MTADRPSPRINITSTWARLNEGMIRLVDYVPDDKMDWSPKPELWNFRGILLHVVSARDGWLGRDIKDGVAAPNVGQTVRTTAEIKQALLRWSTTSTTAPISSTTWRCSASRRRTSALPECEL